MTYSQDHMLLAFGGTLYGDEQWSTSLRCFPGFGDGGGFGSGTPLIPSPNMQTVADEVAAWWLSIGFIGRAAKLGWVKWNAIGTNGRYREATTDLVEYDPEVTTSGSATPVYPPQISLVVTLETGITRGLAGRGRMFLPAPTLPIGTNGTLTEANSTEVATKVAALLSALNEDVEGGRRVGVFSNTREGAARVVTGVSVGTVYDTMRSRRAQKTEVRPAVTPVTGAS